MMSTATQWITDEDRATVEAAIQHEVRTNGHGPLSADVLSILIEHAARMVVAHRGSVGSHALTIARLLWPAPRMNMDNLEAIAHGFSVREGKPATPSLPKYRPEPPTKGKRLRK